MDLREVGEREAIARITKAIGATTDLGRGQDDCAAVPLDDGTYLLVSTDMVLGETHMLPGVTPHQVGQFAVEIAVSDVAAMGGKPLGVMCGYAMPPGTDIEWLVNVTRGMTESTKSLGASLLGGDTKASPERTIAVTALGTVEAGQCMFRRGAQEGDLLLLTGPVGGPALGYNMQRHEDGSLSEQALELVYGVRARDKAGLALATSGYTHACIDLSDGLAPCLDQLMQASNKGAVVEWSNIPLIDGLEVFPQLGLDPMEMALHWGGEYELLAAIDPDGVEPLSQVLRRLGLEPAIVGKVHGAARKNIIVSERGQEALKPHGFDHFQG